MRPLEEIRNQIFGESEDARFTAWMELYRSPEEAAKNEIRKIITDDNPLPKLLFIRFLARIPEEEAVASLLQLLQDNDDAIGNAAKKGLDKNHYELKNQRLLPLLHSRSDRTQEYAIEKLSRGGVVEAIPPLLSLLPQADDRRLLKLLSALRYLPDKRTLPPTLPYLKDPREEVRFQAVLILGSLHETGVAGIHKQLMPLLKDLSAKVRKATLWSLRKAPSQDDLVPLMTVSLEDPDAYVRREGLLGLCSFQTVETIHHLLTVLVTEKERIVRLQCEGVLLSMPPELLTSGLQKILKLKNDPVREKAILLFASLHQKSSFFFDFLVQELKRQKEDKKKILLLQAFGELADERGLPVLSSYLTGSPPIAYAAFSALIQIWKRQGNPDVTPYLQNPQFSPLLKQMVLRFIVRQAKSIRNQEALIPILTTFLDHANTNIRYLSTQILVQIAAKSTYGALLKTFLKEADPTAQKFLADHLVLLGWTDPDLLASSLAPYKDQPEIISLFLSLLKKEYASRDQFLKLFQALLEPPLTLHETVLRDDIAKFLLHHLQEDPTLLPLALEEIDKIPGSLPLLRSFIELLGFQPKSCRILLPFSLLKNWFETADEEKQNLIIDLMGLSSERSPIPFLVSLVANPSLSRLHSRVSKNLNKLIEASA
ncbi:MAG: HEAT repeat domain-containing protein [Deltaproteobacteria bacterium]|nr:HEAT repeat domain-containing protein [Deltaproteobacteria bacterium]